MTNNSESAQLVELQEILRGLTEGLVWYEVTEDMERLEAGDRFTLSEVGLTGDLLIDTTADQIIEWCKQDIENRQETGLIETEDG